MDEVEFGKQPSGACWVDVLDIDILVMYGVATGKFSGVLLGDTLKKSFPTLNVQNLGFPNVTKENFDFSPEKVEQAIAR